ncbi:unnamed protein product [Closterium sp. Yama58-4]|nr:unnamed protein product [Closterium sp. Yama58-4]
MPRFKTAFNGYSARFSPFVENRLAVATAQNFGIIGNGRLHVLELSPGGGLVEVMAYDTADGLYDCCWSEANENLLVSASGDGSVKIWDLALPPASNPIRSFEEHIREVQSVDWNVVRRDSFLSSSWDDTIKLWALESGQSLRTFREHTYCVYSAVWNPAHPDVFASASGDCTLRIWDLREPRSVLILPAHDMEILSCDWNKYGGGSLIATASVDRTICMWDIRAPRPGPGHPEPLARLQGHAYAVRRVRCSPFHEPLLASASYDMTVCSWDFRAPEDALLGKLDHHTEFAVGLDWSPLVEGLMVSGETPETLVSEPATTAANAPAQASSAGPAASAAPAGPAAQAAQATQAAQQLARWRQQQGASWQSFALDLAVGGALGGVSHTIVAPIERVKLLLQTQDSNAAILAGQHRRYRGFVDAVTTIVKEEGFWALWRGNGTSVMRYYPSLALNFAFKDYYRVLFAPSHLLAEPSASRIAAGNFLAGAAAGATSLLVTYPLDVAHTRLATDIGTRRQFAGMRSVIVSLWRAEGIRGLYRGFPASVHGIIVHRSLYFGGFDSAKQLLLKGHGAATTTASIVSYPFDTVRHRMMMQAGLAKPRRGEAGRAGPAGVAGVAAVEAAAGSGAGVARGAGTVLSAVGSGGAAAGMGLAAVIAGAEATGGVNSVNPVNPAAVATSMHAAQTPNHVYRQEGVLGFYKGLFSNILRGTGAAFILVMYDEVRQFVHGDKAL